MTRINAPARAVGPHETTSLLAPRRAPQLGVAFERADTP